MDEEVALFSLHDHPELVADCCKLLNEEWPRSEVARLRSIENSNPNLPVSLLLVILKRGNTNNNEVIGHAKISRLPNNQQSCWVESVVIRKAYRGKGYGWIIMEGCEQFARNLHFTTIYLSTHDKAEFYKKLGFNFCEPICHYGSGGKLSVNKLNGSISPDSSKTIATNQLTATTATNHQQESIEVQNGTKISYNSTPPPPPPLPAFSPKIFTKISGKVYMKKVL